MFEAYKKGATWRRIGILLAILVALVLAPGIVSLVVDPFVERRPPADPSTVDIVEPARFRLFDRDGDGRIDCGLRVPATRWTRVGYRREGSSGCEGRRVVRMPDDLATLADEALALRRDHGLSAARLVDLDADGGVDCLAYDGTWRFAPGSACGNRRDDARELTAAERAAADRLLAIEGEIAERWVTPLLDD